MTKSQLIDRIAERAPHVPRREIERIVNTVFDSMIDALKGEQRIEIRGFGSFAVKVREAREARNPKTGERVAVPRRLTPFFTVGKELRDRLNRASSTQLEQPAPARPAPPPSPSESGGPVPAASGDEGAHRVYAG